MRKAIKNLEVIGLEQVVAGKRLAQLQSEWDDIKSLFPRYYIGMMFNDFNGYKQARADHSYKYVLRELEDNF